MIAFCRLPPRGTHDVSEGSTPNQASSERQVRLYFVGAKSSMLTQMNLSPHRITAEHPLHCSDPVQLPHSSSRGVPVLIPHHHGPLGPRRALPQPIPPDLPSVGGGRRCSGSMAGPDGGPGSLAPIRQHARSSVAPRAGLWAPTAAAAAGPLGTERRGVSQHGPRHRTAILRAPHTWEPRGPRPSTATVSAVKRAESPGGHLGY